MKSLSLWLAWLTLALIFASHALEDRLQRMEIKSDEYSWATEVCEPKGWRTIIINHRNQLTVKCIGGGVHLYDASNRRAEDSDSGRSH